MFKYLICYIVLKLHENRYYQLDISINLDHLMEHISSYTYDIWNVKIKAKINHKDANRLKPYKLDESNIFIKILNNLGPKLTYIYQFDSEKLSHDIDINYMTSENHGVDIEQNNQSSESYFFEKASIKEDKDLILNKSPYNEKLYQLTILNDQNIAINDSNIVYMNIDDEKNIQSMHTLIFSRQQLYLNCCSTCGDLVKMIMKVYLNKNRYENKKYEYIILLDHVIDVYFGFDVINEVNDIKSKFGLNITWVLLSSTEDKNVIQNYKEVGLIYFIEKPLTVGKLKKFLEEYNENNNQ